MCRRSARLAAESDDAQPNAINNLGSTYTTYQDDSITVEHKPEPPFRLLDLPAEIRDRIYSHAFANRATRYLSCFTIPPLVLASRQLRDEALPILFAESNFCLRIGCNRRTDLCKSKAGVLGIKRVIGKFLEIVDESALLRNISIEVFDADDMDTVRRRERRGRLELRTADSILAPIRAGMNLQVIEGSLRVSVDEPGLHPDEAWYFFAADFDLTIQKVKNAVEKASGIARKIGERDGFKGFKISDLRSIAKAFRLGD